MEVTIITNGEKTEVKELKTLSVDRPSTSKQEYHYNGKDAWYSTEYKTAKFSLLYTSKRYSYRWHKTHVSYNGKRLLTSSDYKKADTEISNCFSVGDL